MARSTFLVPSRKCHLHCVRTTSPGSVGRMAQPSGRQAQGACIESREKRAQGARKRKGGGWSKAGSTLKGTCLSPRDLETKAARLPSDE
eukprot:8176883-Pyramimonas_sp.AAC.1